MNPSRRDFLKLSGAALLSVASTRVRPVLAEAAVSAPVIWRGSLHHRYVALTYDDCYLVKKMQELEKLLADYPEVRVTLFPVGTAISNNETKDHGIWKRFHDRGHEIGYHSWDHTNLAVMSPASVLTDYDKWLDALTKALGFEPKMRFARPPFGVLSYSFESLCERRGLVATMWSAAGGGETDIVMKNTFAKIRNGDIVLLHIRTDDIKTTRETLPYLKEQKIEAVTMTRMYDDVLRERNQSDGCEIGSGISLTRTCIE